MSKVDYRNKVLPYFLEQFLLTMQYGFQNDITISIWILHYGIVCWWNFFFFWNSASWWYNVTFWTSFLHFWYIWWK